MTPNQIRNKALKVCKDPEAARAAWAKIIADPRCHGRTAITARLAMLTALAEGRSIRDAAKAARAVLA